MSTTSLLISSNKENIFKKSSHRRKDSGELDVFEAARYFSGAVEVSNAVQKIMRDHRSGGGRISLDIQMGKNHSNVINNNNQIPSSHNIHVIEKQITSEKKYKQPSSPVGKLASFLSSIFNQTSKKKKSSKSGTQSRKDEDESPGGRRKRRSSISHLPSTQNSNYSSSFYTNSTNTSGFRTPPPYSQVPSKSCKETRSYPEHKPQFITLLKQSKKQGNWQIKSPVVQNEVFDDKGSKFADLSNGFSEKVKIRETEKKPELKKSNIEVIDDGAASDSSSDLFELENYDLGYYPSGLPVYETTHVDSIKRSGAI